jgi:hypothetical protein
MSRAWRAWTAYWFAPQPMANLAVCRILWVAFQLGYWFTFGQDWLGDLAEVPEAMYRPLFVVRWLLRPFGDPVSPPLEAVPAVYWVTVTAGLFALVGCLTTASLALFAAGSAFLQGLLYSFGDLHHSEAAMILALGLIALGPSGAALSVDAWWRRRRQHRPPQTTREPLSPFAGWPLRTVQWLLALIYLSAAWAKLTTAGWDWMNGFTLQYYLIRDGLRWQMPLGVWVGQMFPVAWLMGWASMLFEATFFLAVLRPRLARVYVPLGLAFHLGVVLMMLAPFFTYMLLYAAFAPWAAWRATATRAVRSQARWLASPAVRGA